MGTNEPGGTCSTACTVSYGDFDSFLAALWLYQSSCSIILHLHDDLADIHRRLSTVAYPPTFALSGAYTTETLQVLVSLDS